MKNFHKLLIVLFLSSCNIKKCDFYMDKSDPLFKISYEELKIIDPDFVKVIGSSIQGVSIHGERFECVLFVSSNKGIIIEKGGDRVVCFERSTGKFIGRL